MQLGDPQSFNRYSFVSGQPTNYIDPSGLIEGAPRVGCVYNNERNRWDCPTLEIPSGGGGTWDDPDPSGGFEFPGGSGGETVPLPDKLPFDNCTDFVKYLSGLLKVAPNKPTHSLQNAAVVGSNMMHLAYTRYNDHINNGFDGFKASLVGSGKGQQGAGV